VKSVEEKRARALARRLGFAIRVRSDGTPELVEQGGGWALATTWPAIEYLRKYERTWPGGRAVPKDAA
jgi:hypothetical protein